MKDMRPVERLRDLPCQAMKCRSDLLFVGRHRRRAEYEVEHLEPRFFDGILILGFQQRLSEMRVDEVDAVELAIELRRIAHDHVLPWPAWLPSMVTRHPRATERNAARFGVRPDGMALHLGMLCCGVRAFMARERMLVRDDRPPIVD